MDAIISIVIVLVGIGVYAAYEMGLIGDKRKKENIHQKTTKQKEKILCGFVFGPYMSECRRMKGHKGRHKQNV